MNNRNSTRPSTISRSPPPAPIAAVASSSLSAAGIVAEKENLTTQHHPTRHQHVSKSVRNDSVRTVNHNNNANASTTMLPIGRNTATFSAFPKSGRPTNNSIGHASTSRPSSISPRPSAVRTAASLTAASTKMHNNSISSVTHSQRNTATAAPPAAVVAMPTRSSSSVNGVPSYLRATSASKSKSAAAVAMAPPPPLSHQRLIGADRGSRMNSSLSIGDVRSTSNVDALRPSNSIDLAAGFPSSSAFSRAINASVTENEVSQNDEKEEGEAKKEEVVRRRSDEVEQQPLLFVSTTASSESRARERGNVAMSPSPATVAFLAANGPSVSMSRSRGGGGNFSAAVSMMRLNNNMDANDGDKGGGSQQQSATPSLSMPADQNNSNLLLLSSSHDDSAAARHQVVGAALPPSAARVDLDNIPFVSTNFVVSCANSRAVSRRGEEDEDDAEEEDDAGDKDVGHATNYRSVSPAAVSPIASLSSAVVANASPPPPQPTHDSHAVPKEREEEKEEASLVRCDFSKFEQLYDDDNADGDGIRRDEVGQNPTRSTAQTLMTTTMTMVMRPSDAARPTVAMSAPLPPSGQLGGGIPAADDPSVVLSSGKTTDSLLSAPEVEVARHDEEGTTSLTAHQHDQHHPYRLSVLSPFSNIDDGHASDGMAMSLLSEDRGLRGTMEGFGSVGGVGGAHSHHPPHPPLFTAPTEEPFPYDAHSALSSQQHEEEGSRASREFEECLSTAVPTPAAVRAASFANGNISTTTSPSLHTTIIQTALSTPLHQTFAMKSPIAVAQTEEGKKGTNQDGPNAMNNTAKSSSAAAIVVAVVDGREAKATADDECDEASMERRNQMFMDLPFSVSPPATPPPPSNQKRCQGEEEGNKVSSLTPTAVNPRVGGGGGGAVGTPSSSILSQAHRLLQSMSALRASTTAHRYATMNNGGTAANDLIDTEAAGRAVIGPATPTAPKAVGAALHRSVDTAAAAFSPVAVAPSSPLPPYSSSSVLMSMAGGREAVEGMGNGNVARKRLREDSAPAAEGNAEANDAPTMTSPQRFERRQQQSAEGGGGGGGGKSLSRVSIASVSSASKAYRASLLANANAVLRHAAAMRASFSQQQQSTSPQQQSPPSQWHHQIGSSDDYSAVRLGRQNPNVDSNEECVPSKSSDRSLFSPSPAVNTATVAGNDPAAAASSAAEAVLLTTPSGIFSPPRDRGDQDGEGTGLLKSNNAVITTIRDESPACWPPSAEAVGKALQIKKKKLANHNDINISKKDEDDDVGGNAASANDLTAVRSVAPPVRADGDDGDANFDQHGEEYRRSCVVPTPAREKHQREFTNDGDNAIIGRSMTRLEKKEGGEEKDANHATLISSADHPIVADPRPQGSSSADGVACDDGGSPLITCPPPRAFGTGRISFLNQRHIQQEGETNAVGACSVADADSSASPRPTSRPSAGGRRSSAAATTTMGKVLPADLMAVPPIEVDGDAGFDANDDDENSTAIGGNGGVANNQTTMSSSRVAQSAASVAATFPSTTSAAVASRSRTSGMVRVDTTHFYDDDSEEEDDGTNRMIGANQRKAVACPDGLHRGEDDEEEGANHISVYRPSPSVRAHHHHSTTSAADPSTLAAPFTHNPQTQEERLMRRPATSIVGVGGGAGGGGSGEGGSSSPLFDESNIDFGLLGSPPPCVQQPNADDDDAAIPAITATSAQPTLPPPPPQTTSRREMSVQTDPMPLCECCLKPSSRPSRSSLGKKRSRSSGAPPTATVGGRSSGGGHSATDLDDKRTQRSSGALREVAKLLAIAPREAQTEMKKLLSEEEENTANYADDTHHQHSAAASLSWPPQQASSSSSSLSPEAHARSYSRPMVGVGAVVGAESSPIAAEDSSPTVVTVNGRTIITASLHDGVRRSGLMARAHSRPRKYTNVAMWENFVLVESLPRNFDVDEALPIVSTAASALRRSSGGSRRRSSASKSQPATSRISGGSKGPQKKVN